MRIVDAQAKVLIISADRRSFEWRCPACDLWNSNQHRQCQHCQRPLTEAEMQRFARLSTQVLASGSVIINMRCSHCGHEFDQRLKFCPECGARSRPIDMSSQSGIAGIALYTIGGVLLALLGLAGTVLVGIGLACGSIFGG